MDRSHDPNAPCAPPRPSIDSFTRGFVQKAARQLAGKFGFAPQDREDIQQQLYLKLAKQLRSGNGDDPKWKALVAVTVRRHVTNMIRDRCAQKRDHNRTQPFSHDQEAQVHEPPVGQVGASEIEWIELRVDLAECLAGIRDPSERELCRRLQLDSVSQVAKDLQIPRTTLNSRLQKLRVRFEAHGLKEYL